MAVNIDKDKCTGCGTCVDACPSGALSLVDEKCVCDPDLCIDCYICIPECPEEAISE